MALQTFTAGQVLTAAQVTALQANDYNQTVSTKTDSYTLVAADKGTRVVMNKATATTITVNTSLFSAGDTLWIHNVGAGVCTITAGTATVSTSGSLALAQNAGGTLYFTSAGVAIFFPTVASSAQGMTLINTTSFSGVASQSFTSIFSSTYDNYRIVVNISGNSANDGDQFLRLRLASTDATTNYQYSSFIKTATGTDQSFNSTTPTYIKLGAQDNASAQGQAYSVDIISPFLAQYTKFNCNVTLQTDAGAWCGGVIAGLNYNQTSYDGFTLHTQNGTFTGTASVYGYNK